MPYQRCISTLGCPGATLAEALELAGQHALDAVELRALGGRIDLPAYLTAAHGSPAQLVSTLSGHSVRVAALDTSLRLLENTPADRTAFREFLPWAEALNARWLRLFDGGHDLARDLPAAVDTFRWWQAEKARHAWTADLMIETHDALRDSATILELVAACPGIGILWDTHHTWSVGGEQPAATWRRIRDHVVHIHVKDSVPVPSGGHPFSYVPPGSGAFPMGDLRPLLAAEFRGCVSLEWERHWHPELPPVEDALRAAFGRGWW